MDNTKQSQAILSFCTGSRGLEKGIERAGTNLTAVAYVEIEAFIIQNLVGQMEKGVLDPAPIWTDIKTFPSEQFHGKIHGIVGGYPCQGESHAGKRKLWDDPRFLWPYIERCIERIKPVWCFFENVEGHLTGSFPYVLESLRSMGYTVEAGIFTASEVGASHKRKRVFILGYASDIDKQHDFLQSIGSQIKTRRPSSILDYSNDNKPTKNRQDIKENRENEKRKCWTKYRSALSGRTSFKRVAELANADHKRPQGGGHKIYERKRPRPEERSFGLGRGKWPAGPGQNQFVGEEQRTVKSGVGCTINGYNFRTDLLRMYGNGVVEQTAELAWKTLWEKQIKNLTI